MEDPDARRSTARLIAIDAVLVTAFPLVAWLAVLRSSGSIPGSPGAWWRADLVGVAAPAVWLGGCVLSLWLLVTTLAYSWASRRGHLRLRRLVGLVTAPAVRRAVDAALLVTIGAAAFAPAPALAARVADPPAGSSTAAPVVRSGAAVLAATTTDSTPATATTASTRPGPDAGTRPSVSAAPVVRGGGPGAPEAPASPTRRTSPDLRPTTATASAPFPTTTRPERTPPVPATTAVTRAAAPRVPAPPVDAAAAAPVTPANHVVAAGESLWSIAADRVRVRPADAAPTDADVARYWAAVVAANRATLRSGEPSLVFPGEVVQLPPVG